MRRDAPFFARVLGSICHVADETFEEVGLSPARVALFRLKNRPFPVSAEKLSERLAKATPEGRQRGMEADRKMVPFLAKDGLEGPEKTDVTKADPSRVADWKRRLAEGANFDELIEEARTEALASFFMAHVANANDDCEWIGESGGRELRSFARHLWLDTSRGAVATKDNLQTDD